MSALSRVPGALAAWLLLGLIAIYRASVSPWLGGRCRFSPTCSEYAAGSIRAYGPLRGSWRALLRISKCHPFHSGGYDPPVRET